MQVKLAGRWLLLIAIALVSAAVFFVWSPERKQRGLDPVRLVQSVKKTRPVQKQSIQSLPQASPPQITPPPTAIEQPSTVEAIEISPQNKLNERIEAADKRIAENPDDYFAYKDKLISLINLEISHGQSVDPELYDLLYEELLTFESGGLSVLHAQQNGTVSAELDGIDQDLIHIPFLRLAALGDLEELAARAEEYITAYPESYVGYLYLAEAFLRDGDPDQALNVFSRGVGTSMPPETVEAVFTQITAEPPLSRLNRMSFAD